jgi:arsenite methyltransferase
MADVLTSDSSKTEEAIKDYYGKQLTSSVDLKTNACTSNAHILPRFIRNVLGLIHEEVTTKYYGCGPVFPSALTGAAVLDLGSGSGRDCYVLSKLVGEEGSVVGLDMTDEQLATANKYIDYHTRLFSYSTPNVRFLKGYMENLKEAGLDSQQFDIIVSNCVINLSQDKSLVLKEAYRVLKEGGELYFSDVYSDRDLPANVREHKELWCECVAGAINWTDLYKLAKEIGFSVPRLVTSSLISIQQEEYPVLGDAKFVSATYRLFKLPAGPGVTMSVVYNGDIEGFEEELLFDHGITFQRGEECHVKPELAQILKSSRYNKYFTITPGQKGPCKCAKLDKDPFEYCTEKGNKKSCC